jgi:hypothetical protein
MKKRTSGISILILLVVLAFGMMVTGCDEQATYTFINQSSHTVTVTFEGSTFDMSPGTTTTRSGNMWAATAYVTPGDKVTIEADGFIFTIRDR